MYLDLSRAVLFDKDGKVRLKKRGNWAVATFGKRCGRIEVRVPQAPLLSRVIKVTAPKKNLLFLSIYMRLDGQFIKDTKAREETEQAILDGLSLAGYLAWCLHMDLDIPVEIAASMPKALIEELLEIGNLSLEPQAQLALDQAIMKVIKPDMELI